MDGRPAADCCVDLELTAQQLNPLLHSEQAKALAANAPAPRLGKIEAGAVVADDQAALVSAS